MKKCLLFIFFAVPCFGQVGLRYDNIAIRGTNPLVALPNVQITVCTPPASGNPCTPLATTYTDATLTTPCPAGAQVVLSNTSTCVGTSDVAGNYGFWVAPNATYVVTVTIPGTPGITNTITMPGSNSTNLPAIVTVPNPVNFDVDMHFKGRNPYSDVTRYGVRGLTSSTAIPAIAGITGTINAFSSSLAISTQSCPAQTGGVCFPVNGDGIVVYGAGATTALSTPGTPTVTPSLARVGTGTGDTVASPAGGTAYQYQIVARDKQGGLTAASTAGTTATGQASLGSQSVSISSATCSGTTVTVTTSAPHTLATGAHIMITATTGGNSCIGGVITTQVTGSSDNTHFTYSQGISTANGGATASLASLVGTVFWMNCNHVTWTPVANTWEYYVYGRTGGGMALLGVTHPSGLVTDTTFDDFGSTMMAETTLGIPGYVPTTPPVAATPQPLITTISSGAGTTTLTLANAATTNVTNSTVLFTNGPNILTACAAAPNLYWPFGAGSFVVNSFTDVAATCTNNNSWMYTGGLVLNETMTFRGSLVGDVPNNVVGNITDSFNLIGEPVVTTNANPGIYSPSGGAFFDRLALKGGQNPLFVDAGNVPSNLQFGQHVYLSTVNNSTDYMGIALYMRGQAGNISINGVHTGLMNVQTGPGQEGGGFTGSTFTPAIYCNDCGNFTIRGLFMQNRGLLYRPDPGGGGSLTLNWHYRQGAIAPLITVTGPLSIGQSTVVLDLNHFTSDTSSEPFLSYLPSAFAAVGNVLIGQMENTPSGSTAFITGPTQNWFVNGSVSGQNTNAISKANFTDNSVQVLGTGNQGYQLQAPATPTVALSGGTGPLAGTYTYAIFGVDAFPTGGGSGSLGTGLSQISATSAPITVNGSQGVLVSWTLQPGQNSTIVCRALSPGGLACPDSGAGFRVAGTSFLDTGYTPNSSVPQTGFTGLSAGVNSSGSYAQQLTLTSTLFANLGTPSNGKFVYCSDCTIANPCAGGGNGALAKRLNGAWVCN